jgi:hypothetical protein
LAEEIGTNRVWLGIGKRMVEVGTVSFITEVRP